MISKQTLETSLYTSVDGPNIHLSIHYTDYFINAVQLKRNEDQQLSWSFQTSSKNEKLEQLVYQWIKIYQSKQPQTFHLPFLFNKMSPFAQKVIEILIHLPFGQVLSYQEVASLAGSPRAARAVGTICKRNVFPFFIPCHRIVASGRKLGGFSAGGLEVKTTLLNFEGVQLI